MNPIPSRPESLSNNSRVNGYLFAVGCVAVSTLAVVAFPWVSHMAPFLLYWPAIIFTLWYAGFGPALLSTILSALSVDFFLIPPYYSFSMTNWRNDLVRLMLFVLIMGTSSFVLDWQRKRANFHLQLQGDLLELADEAIFITDVKHRVVYWNGGAERLYGWTKSEVLGMDVGHLMDSIYPGGREICDRALEDTKHWHGRLLRKNKRGEFVVTESNWTLHSATETILQTDVDVTERSRAEDAERRLTVVLRMLSDVNQTLLHAQDETELLQKSVDIIAREGIYPLAWIGIPIEDEACSIRIAARSGRAVDYLQDIDITWKDDVTGHGPCGTSLREGRGIIYQDFMKEENLLPWHARASRFGISSVISEPLYDQGKVVASLNVYSTETNAFGEREVALIKELAGDLSVGISAARARKAIVVEQQRRILLEEQLQQSQRLEAIGQLAGGIAHDFNNLLMVIMAQTEMLSTNLEGNSLRRAENVMKSAQRAAALTGQLLAFSRKQVIQPQVMSFNHVIPGVEEMVKRLVREDIEVRFALSERPWMVEIDRSQFEQVIMNLVVNARDAMPEGGVIIVETENYVMGSERLLQHPLVPPGDYAMLAVSDTGTGMDDEVKARIFEPFYTTKDTGKGTGLGLSMVYGIVKQNGGHIWVYSEVNHGTTFKILIPRVRKLQLVSDERPADGSSKSLRKATILLVEDEKSLREVISDFLTSGGHTVLAADGPAEACRLASKHHLEIELLLTDVILKEGNGRQLVERVGQLGCEFKVVYMSGYTPNAIVHHGVLEPNMMFIQKPFSRESILNVIENALANEA